jgi:hypothetical protein
VEFGGALLLLWRRTTALGALILAGALTNVVAMNFGYGVGAKVFAVTYLLTALFLLASEARRLADMFLFNRPVAPATLALAGRPAARRASLTLKALVVLAMVGWHLARARGAYFRIGDGAPLPPLYGLYEVEEFRHAGGAAPAAPDTAAGWSRVALAENSLAAIQPARGAVQRYIVETDTAARVLRMQPRIGAPHPITLRYVRQADGRLRAAGTAGADSVAMLLRPVGLGEFRLRQPLR